MTADQHNRLIAHAKTLVADPKWMKAALPSTREWAKYWASLELREVVEEATA